MARRRGDELRLVRHLAAGAIGVILFALLVQAAGSRPRAEPGLLTEIEYSGTWEHTYQGSPSGSAKNPGAETVTSKVTFSESVSVFTSATDLSQGGHGANSTDSPVKVTLSGKASITYTGSNLTGCSATFFAKSGLSGDQWGSALPLAYISVNERDTKGVVAVYAEVPGLRSSSHPEFVVRRTGGNPSNNACDSGNMPIGEFPCNNISLINDPQYTPGDRGFNHPPYGLVHAVARLDPHTPTYSHAYPFEKAFMTSCDGKDTVTAKTQLIVNNRRANGPPAKVPPVPDPTEAKLEAKEAAQGDLAKALLSAPLCAGVGVTLSSGANPVSLGLLVAMSASVAGRQCYADAARVKNDLDIIQRKDPPLGPFARRNLPGCGNLSGAALTSCNTLRAAGAALIAAAQRAAVAANTLDVAFVALNNALQRHQQTTITKEVPVVKRAIAGLRAAAAAESAARTTFYRLIGEAGAGVRLTKQQSAAGISKFLGLLRARGVKETIVRKYAGSALVPKAAVIAVAASKPSRPPSSSKPTITSVSFIGGPESPTIVVHGKNLGKLPAPNPSSHPSGLNRCPVVENDNGYLYGTSLYIAVPSQNWSGGRYRPSANETDCLDLVVTTFTPTEVRFHFGPFYSKFYPQFALAAGLQATVVVNGARFNTTVKYD